MKIDGNDMQDAKEETLDRLTKVWQFTNTLQENVEAILDEYMANLTRKGI